MFLSLFITGVVVGFLVAMPVGPIGVLIIQRTVNKSRSAGLISGFGAACSDVFYAIVAGFSLSYIIDFVRSYEFEFQVGGALAVIGLGLHIFFKNPVRDLKKYRRKGNTHLQDFVSTFFLTLTNPITIFVFIALFAGSGVVFNISQPYHALFVILGIFTGACAWWLTLTEVVNLFKHRFNLRLLWWFNKIAGAAIILFVIVTLSIALVADLKI